MNHSAWVKSQCAEWPYAVQVDDHASSSFARATWLEMHVGKRNAFWEYVTPGVYVFLYEHDAVEFSLTWS